MIPMFVIIRDACTDEPRLADSEAGLDEEINYLHSELGDTGFTVFKLTEETRYTFEPARLRKLPVSRPAKP